MRCLYYRLFNAFVALIVCSTLFAQNDHNVIQEDGKSYILYTVEQGEGFFSIQKKYDFTKEELLEANKGLAEKGLRRGQVLKIPIKGEIKETEVEKVIFHTIAKGESIMGITKRYKISVEQLFDRNPDLSASTFTVGRIVRISPFAQSDKPSSLSCARYVVQSQETLYGLSKRFGLTVEELAAANGNIVTVNVGQELIIPEKSKVQEPIQAVVADHKVIDSVADVIQPNSFLSRNKSSETSVAILFPLGLDSKGDPEMTKRLMEYYRGFILSADSVRKNGDNMSISFYDTGNGTAKIDSIIATGELNQVDVIVAPSYSDQIDRIVAFGQSHGIRVALPFSSKGEWASAHSMVMQMNPSVALQNNLVFDHWKQRYRNANFIFISGKGLVGEKTEFVQSAKKYLKDNGFAFKQFTHHIDSMADIQTMIDPNVENIIISDFASVRNLKTIMLDLQMVVKQQPASQVILWGYPEWQTFFLEFGDAYFDLNVHLFTTFYADYSNAELKRVEMNFRNVYQRNMLNTYPRFALLGYDMGLYLLSGKFERKEQMEGLQSGFNFKRTDRNKGGLVNNSLFIVEYTKDQTIKRLNITDN